MCHAYDTETDTKLEDRLTSLPESLKLHVLSSLEAKYVVRTSVLSKSWVSLWKSVPILRVSSYSFQKLSKFDEFVEKQVCQSMNVDTLIFKHGRLSSKEMLEKVIRFACSSNVKHLDVSTGSGEWPDLFHGYPDSLKSLKLHSNVNVLCSYLGPQATLFKNLTELYLESATIHDLDPFSGFPVLNKLTLSWCKVDTSGSTFKIHSKHLFELSILAFGCCNCINDTVPASPYKPFPKIDCIELITPKLRMFEYEGSDYPNLETCDGLHNLDSVVINSATGFRFDRNEKSGLDNLMIFFMKVYNVKLLKVCPDIVYKLESFPDKLVNRSTPFQDLKSLTIDFEDRYRNRRPPGFWPNYRHWEDAPSNVKDYLLRKSSEYHILRRPQTLTYTTSLDLLQH